jgi:hypothetical protein
MPYTTVFGEQPIYSAQPSLLALALDENLELDWPLETSNSPKVLATIIDVTPDAPARVITMPDARNGTPGYAVTFANSGADTFIVNNNAGVGLIAVASGERWTVYLRTNSTAAGTWGSFQQGAGTSTANAGALAGAGLKAIGSTLNTRLLPSDKAVNYVVVETDRAAIIAWTGGAGQITLPDPAVVGIDWYVGVKNAGSGSVTVLPSAGLVDGSGSLILAPGESAFFYTDGINFFTIGLGQEINSVFDFISINVAGTGDYTLSGVELNRVSYRLTGILTGNRNIIVPATTQQYWVDNQTTGAFTVTIKAAGGVDPGKTIAQNNRNIFYCNGANVLDAVSGAFTPPLAVGAGGTGATTAANARTNLGSTAVGDAVFIAVSAAAARLAIGAVGDTRAVNTTNSLTGGGDLSADRTLQLVNDSAAPGANQYYGTNGAGTKGFFALGSSSTVLKVKTASTNRTNSTLSNDPQLAGWNLTAGKRYALRGHLSFFVGTTGPGIAILLQMSNNPQYMYGELMYNDGTAGTGNGQPLTNIYAGSLNFATAAAQEVAGWFDLIFQANAGVGGTLDFQWAQSVTNAVATVLRNGSYLELTQLD